eukprot:jgi/Chlat1/4993/Chrsp32S04933
MTTAVTASTSYRLSPPLLPKGGSGGGGRSPSPAVSLRIAPTRTSSMTTLASSSSSPSSSSPTSSSGLMAAAAAGSGVVGPVVALLGVGGAVRAAVKKVAKEGIALDDHVTLKWRGWLGAARRRPSQQQQQRRPSPPTTASASSDGVRVSGDRRGGLLGGIDTGFAARVALAMFLGVANRVLYKMALVPLQPDYVFFLAQVTTFGYVVVYFLTLSIRYRAGLVTPAMLSLPKWRFAVMGVLEALGFTMGLAGAAQLPGAVGGALLPVLNQTYLVWQLALSAILLKRKFRPAQVVGAGLLVVGVVVAARQNSGPAGVDAAAQALRTAGAPVLLYAASMVPSALSSIFKEWTFNDAKKRLGSNSKPLDIFVVNSFSSGFQALCVLALLPLLASLRGVKPADLPSYLVRGGKCFVGMNPGTPGADCRGAPLLPLLYVAVNMAFNVASLSLLRASSAVVASITGAATVPLAVLAFTLPLPYLGAPAALGPDFLLGLVLLLAGMLLYNVPVPALVCRVAPFLGGTCEYSCPNDNPARKCC